MKTSKPLLVIFLTLLSFGTTFSQNFQVGIHAGGMEVQDLDTYTETRLPGPWDLQNSDYLTTGYLFDPNSSAISHDIKDILCVDSDSLPAHSLFFEICSGTAWNLFDNRGTTLAAFLYYSHHKHYFSVRALTNMEMFLKDTGTPVEQYNDVSLLYGYKFIGDRYVSIIPFVGVGRMTHITKGEKIGTFDSDTYETLKSYTGGLSLGLKFMVSPKYFGLGAYLFSNINSMQSYYGALFCFSIGKFY